MYADIKNYGDDSEEVEFRQGEHVGMKIGAKAFVCGGEVGEKKIFVITDEIWLRVERKRRGRGREDVREDGYGVSVQKRLERLMAFRES